MSTISDDNGPRCVPLIHDGLVFVFGAGGDLHCLQLKDGEKLWSRETFKDYNAPTGYFGAGSTPIVEGDKLLVNVGGDKAGAGIVAFDLKTGKTVWTATKELASYSSPTAVTLGGIRHVIFVTRLHALSLDPADGSVRWEFPFGARGPTVNAATPLVLDGNLFLSASYGVGAVFAKIEPKSAKILWESTDIMSSQYSTCVFHDGLLYGIDGREDIGAASLRCFDPKTQKIHWTEESFGVGNLLLADGKLVIMKVSGELVLARPNGKKYEPLATAKLLNSDARSLPALSNGLIYVRDRRTVKCIDLRRASAD
jgi:outer membrane protein assembly factor BamB